MVAKDSKKDLGVKEESMNPYEKPPEISARQSFKNFFYNKETGAIMGRTPSSWGN